VEIIEIDYGNGEIDPVRYGVLWQRVQEMDKKVDKMERQLEELLALANKSKGGLWLGMSLISILSSVVGYFVSLWNK
jgi:hypothetical protein